MVNILIPDWKRLASKLPLLLLQLVIITLHSCENTSINSPSTPANILLFYVDDLGYGDLSCYGATAVSTPNIDLLAHQGQRFTQAYCASATCTPSRYALLTGQYAFRNEAAVLPGDAPLIIDTAAITLPKLLRQNGYQTAVVGKWHLGLGDGQMDWNGPLTPGPAEVGFDYSFLLPATGDRVPTVYTEQNGVVGLGTNDPLTISYGDPINDEPTGLSHPELLRYPADEQHANSIVNGISRIGYQSGGKAAHWTDEDFADIFTSKANDFITENKDKPFFLYFPFHDIHVPRLPHPRFTGQTEMGPRGDAIVQVDWMVGQIVRHLAQLEILENTLIIFTSDNGPVLNDGYEDQAVELLGDHQPSGPFRGGKYSIFEAGTRVPTIVRMGRNIILTNEVARVDQSANLQVSQSTGHSDNEAGRPADQQTGRPENDTPLHQVDLLASLAHFALGEDFATSLVQNNPRLDSEDHLMAWLGKSDTGRYEFITEGMTLALRQGEWKYIAPSWPGKGQWTTRKGIESGLSSYPQLYNLADDPGETTNLAGTQAARVEAMDQRLRTIVGDDPTKRLDRVTYDYDTTEWTELPGLEPGIALDLRYATPNNFMQQQIYDCGRCFYRKPVAAALAKVHRELAQRGLGLKMFDCYRPAPYQQRLWDILPDARYVARPAKGSLHSRGAAADLTIVDLKTGQELDMGTPYDFFGEEAYTTTTELPEAVLKNRALLQEVMRKHGFGTIRTEWWHFNYLGQRLPLADWVWACS